jgi:hypothetical protein
MTEHDSHRLMDRSLVIPPTTRGFCSIFLRFIQDLSFTARSGFLDHLSGDSFNCRSDRLFHFSRSFLHWRTFGLGSGNRLRLCSLTALPRAADFPLGSFPRFCTFACFLLLAMIRPVLVSGPQWH